MQQQNPVSFGSIQVLRAVAALMIVVAHLYPNLLAFGAITAPIPNFIFGACGVDLFFVISGFVMVYASERFFAANGAARQFLLRRIVRIVPLYWLCTAAIFLAYLVIVKGPINWRHVIASLTFIPYLSANGSTQPLFSVGWTLNHEMFFYACFALVVIFPRRIAIIILTIAFILLIQFGSKLSPHLPASFGFAVWTNTLNYEFIFGVWIAMLYREGVRISLSLAWFLASVGFILLVVTYYQDFTLLSRHIGWGGGAAMIVAAVTLSKARPLSVALWRPLLLCGDASYALYMLHALLPTYVNIFILRCFDPHLHPYAYLVLMLTLTVIGALLLHLFIEKPLTKWLQKLVTRPEISTAPRTIYEST